MLLACTYSNAILICSSQGFAASPEGLRSNSHIMIVYVMHSLHLLLVIVMTAG